MVAYLLSVLMQVSKALTLALHRDWSLTALDIVFAKIILEISSNHFSS